MQRIIIATKNAHKTGELRAMLGAPWEVVDLTAFPELPAAEETGATFEENSAIKALHAAERFSGWVLADDSGLEVDGAENGTAYWFADILPTFASLAGAKPLANLDGQSFASLLRNQPFTPPQRPPFYWEFHEGGFSQAVIIDERWKAIRLKRRDAPVQLFDLEKDLGETTDLAAEKPELIAKAKALFESARTDSTDWPIKDAAVGKGQ